MLKMWKTQCWSHNFRHCI